MISIHAPIRGRHERSTHSASESYFNPRPLVGATIFYFFRLIRFLFQSTPPRGGDPAPVGFFQGNQISIHAPSRGRRPFAFVVVPLNLISIHAPSRGRPGFLATSTNTGAISIHAPSRGRQHDSRWFYTHEHISIHAPSRGRPDRRPGAAATGDFNPRPLAGATRVFVYIIPGITISIHAPSRGRRQPKMLPIIKF